MDRRKFLSTSGMVIGAGAVQIVVPARTVYAATAASQLSNISSVAASSKLPNFANTKAILFPGSDKTVEALLDNAKSKIKSGTFDGSLLATSIEKQNPITGLYVILETAAITVTESIPVVGWLISGFLSIGLKYLNESLKEKTDYEKLIKSIVNKSIDENNYRLMKAAFEGVTQVYGNFSDLAASLSTNKPKPDQKTQLISLFTNTISNCEQNAPTMLLKNLNDKAAYQGIPLFCSIANVELSAHADMLKNKVAFDLDDSFYKNNYAAMEKKAWKMHKKAREVVVELLDNVGDLSLDYPSVWAKKNSIIRQIYLSGLGAFLENYRRRYEAKFLKKIKLRNSIEIYSNSYADQGVIEKTINADITRRSSLLSRLSGYSHIDRVQRIGVGYLSSSENSKGFFKEYESCTGRVNDRRDEKDIDSKFPIDQFVNSSRTGRELPVKVYSNAPKAGAYGLKIITNDGKNIDFGSMKGDLKKFYSFDVPGYYISGLVVAESNAKRGSCAADSGLSIDFICSVHRHCSSIDYIAGFTDANIGIELDNSVWSFENNSSSNVTGYADYLVGKNILSVPSGSVKFDLYNTTGKAISVTPVLMAAIPGRKDGESASLKVSIGNSVAQVKLSDKDSDKEDSYIQGIDGEKYLDAASGEKITVPVGRSSISIENVDKKAGFKFASLLLIPG